MFTLPQLLEEDIEVLSRALRELITKSEATAALVIDNGGFLIAQEGNTESFDSTTVGALASAAFSATRETALLIGESNFSFMYQQGTTVSMLAGKIDDHCVLVVVFPAQIGVGVVKYYCGATVRAVADQMKKAYFRNPEGGVDLSVLNVEEPGDVFTRRTP
jgi:predicted regulator of Ras-like GTPase activity (Roadblock/LC7/MglB family)